MYDQSLIDALCGMLNGSNAPLTKRQYIHDFGPFILDHIPYAQVTKDALQMGLVQFDGPKADGVDPHKPPLIWYFGGIPYPIDKAAMIQYNYPRNWDGSGQTVYASIVLGFQSGESKTLAPVPQLPSAHDVEDTGSFVGKLTTAITAIANRMPGAVVARQPRFHDLDWLINEELAQLDDRFKTRVQEARERSRATMLVTARTKAPHSEPQGLPQSALGERASEPSGETPQAGQGSNGHPTSGTQPIEVVVQTSSPVPPVGLPLHEGPYAVQLDGPARDHDSQHIFAYTLETLFADQALFSQILWWYFGGQPVRITKAMRIPIHITPKPGEPEESALFVGYSGPGSYP